MATFADGESGLSVRTKINNVLQHADGTSGELVINDAGADVDFRVESDTLTNALFVDGATGNVGLGTASPTGKLGINISATSGYWERYYSSGTELAYWYFDSTTLQFGTPTGTRSLVFLTSDLEAMRIDPSRRVLIGTTSASGANLLQVNSDARINGLTVGRGTSAVASNTALGSNALLVNTTGNSNTAVGGDPLFSNTGGNSNTAVGYQSLYFNTTGGNNIGIGIGAGSALTTGSNNTIIGSIAGTAGLANTVIIGAGATERLRIDSNGNMGIGVAPSAWSGTNAVIEIGTTAAISSYKSATVNSLTRIDTNSYSDGSNYRYKITREASAYQQYNGLHQWFTAPSGTAGAAITFTQAMTLTASGNLGIGTTTPGGIFAVGEFSATGATQGLRVSDTGRLHDTSTNATVIAAHYRFYNPNGLVGSISTDGSATIYSTSSDYRLKDDIQPVADATERLMELKPVNFAWKADGSRTDGFIAHEVQAVVPQAVTGEKDGDDMQQMDHSKLVPLLTAALQKAIQQIELLEARLDAANL